MTAQARSASTVPLATTPPDRPNAPVPPLLRLPLELHHLVAAQLSLPGYLALRLSHPYLYNVLAAPVPAPSLKNLDSCARLAVRTYLSPYFAGCRGNTKETSPSAVDSHTTQDASTARARGKAKLQSKNALAHCLLCAASYAPRLFKSTSSPAVDAVDHGIPITTYPILDGASPSSPLPLANSSAPAAVEQGRQKLPRSHPDWDVLSLPDGVCAWHASRFARVVHEWPADLPRPTSTSGEHQCSSDAASADNHQIEREQQQQQQWCWLAFTSTLCPHCGAVAAFRACTCCSTRTPIVSTSASNCIASSSDVSSSPRASSAAAPTRTPVTDCEALATTTATPQQRGADGNENATTTTTTTSSFGQSTANIAATMVDDPAATAATSGTTTNNNTANDDVDSITKKHCQTCALRPVTVYVRYLPPTTTTTTTTAKQQRGNRQSWNMSSYRFWRDADDHLWVREEGFVSCGDAAEAETSDVRTGSNSGVAGNWTWGGAWARWMGGGRGTEWQRGRDGGARGGMMGWEMRRGEKRVVDVPVSWARL
ncbi:hypothetical protein BKA81DRAFT_381714 [Phyllosticta paracitricarpa]|uniref:F-box domain-containing protein n=1 Tax=Phyllosticta paracitricarpa TaxID=2016321 RepID=A0ABR1N185_9PEZI